MILIIEPTNILTGWGRINKKGGGSREGKGAGMGGGRIASDFLVAARERGGRKEVVKR